MKICFICNEYPPACHGGIGNATRTLARALVEAGHEVRVVGFYPQDETAPDYESDRGVSVTRLTVPKGALAWMRARYMLYQAVARLVRAGLVDVIEVPDYEGLAAGWSALRVPVVTRLHGSSSYFSFEMGKRPNASTLFIERASLRRAEFLCACSRYTADRTRSLLGLNNAEISILYNSVIIGAPLAVPRRPGQVVFSGTLTAKKGVISLARAWKKVIGSCPGAELQVFGKDGHTDSEQSMQGYMRSILPGPARETVRFHGHVDFLCLRHAFQSANVGVFPSYAEAFALGPMEAMAEGCPTIYSRRGSGTELIDDGENGLLVDPDNPQEIADSIIRVLQDINLAEKLGRKGRESIETRFSLGVLLARNIEFYSKCIETFASEHYIKRKIEPLRGTKWHPQASSTNAYDTDRTS